MRDAAVHVPRGYPQHGGSSGLRPASLSRRGVYLSTPPGESATARPTAEGRAAAEQDALRRAAQSDAYAPRAQFLVPPPQLRIEDAPYPILDAKTVKKDYKPIVMDLVEKVRAAQGRYVKRKSDKPQPFNIQLLLHDTIPNLIQISSMLKSKALRDQYRYQLDGLLQDLRAGQITADSVEAVDDLLNSLIRFNNQGS